MDLGVGTVYTVPYTVRSRGPLPTGDATLTSFPELARGGSLDAGGVAHEAGCDHVPLRAGLAPGATRVVSLRLPARSP